MSRTVIGVNDAKAVKKYSGLLARDTRREGYWTRKFMGAGETASTPIQMLDHLQSDAGEQITYDLSVRLRGEGVEGEDLVEGTGEALSFHTDTLYIDELAKEVNAGGRMTRKRTLHNLREVARARLTEWWASVYDQQFFMYGAGARGVNDYLFPLTWTGRANNALTAPDSGHLIAAHPKATTVATDKMSYALIDKAITKAKTMGGGPTEELLRIEPIRINGEERYVVVMHEFQAYDLRRDTSTGEFLDIQKAAAAVDGQNSPIFKGGLGQYNGVILHAHDHVVRFSDYGASSNVAAARAMFLGKQDMVYARGSPGTGLGFDWHEEMDDRGRILTVTGSSIFGIKKSVFNSKWKGSLAIDTAAADPNA